MRYRALAFDYDGTLATGGHVADATAAALDRASRSGRRLLLVTGRRLDDLEQVWPDLDAFDLVIAENGAVLYDPRAYERTLLADPPPPALLDRLRERNVEPLDAGDVVVATRVPHDVAVLEAIRDLGVEWQITYNKGAVMALPSGVNKATGLAAALDRLKLSRHGVVGVGDAENDHAFLESCEFSVAVANAVPALKERCDLVTDGEAGAGVAELIERVVASDLADLPGLAGGPARHHVLLGRRADDELRLPPYGVRTIVAGPSGSGKSTATFALMERLVEAGYQLCLIDPEGDYEDGIGGASVVVGDADVQPSAQEVIGVLDQPDHSAVVNLLAVPIPDRPGLFEDLLAQLAAYSTRYGRPHWIVIDEAHHLMPRAMETKAVGLLSQIGAQMLITVHPDAVEPGVLATVNTAIAVGGKPDEIFAPTVAGTDSPAPQVDEPELDTGWLAVWRVGEKRAEVVELVPPRAERQRHRRKYALGTMPPDRSFYFRGPDERLNLRAHNVSLFLQLADGVDEETFLHHLRQGDYSTWIESIGNEDLAATIAELERDDDVAAGDARDRLRQAILAEYTEADRPETYGEADS
jgi:hydroxymethylpyrimidine pyrophosphatase-like HAD family hydrolase